MPVSQKRLEELAANLDRRQTIYEKQFRRALAQWTEKHDIILCAQIAMHGCIVDFFFPQIDLVVELDGQHHEAKKDEERDAPLIAKGLHVLHFPNPRDKREMDEILEMIRGEFYNYLADRHWQKLRRSDRNARRQQLRPHR